MRKNAVIGIIALAVLTITTGIVLTRPRGPQPDTPNQTPTRGRGTSAVANLKPAPDFEISLYRGDAVVGSGTIRLSQLWQGRPVVLNFWAGLCPPCRAEMPDFQRLYNENPKGKFVLIGVDIGPFIGLGSREEGQALMRELNITFPTGTTFDARTVAAYGILGMPTTVFINSAGKITRSTPGSSPVIRLTRLSPSW